VLKDAIKDEIILPCADPLVVDTAVKAKIDAATLMGSYAKGFCGSSQSMGSACKPSAA